MTDTSLLVADLLNAAGSDPIGGVGSGGVVEPKGALMSGFEKPPPTAPNAGKGAGRVRRPMGLLC